jgi:hypothetical protein
MTARRRGTKNDVFPEKFHRGLTEKWCIIATVAVVV